MRWWVMAVAFVLGCGDESGRSFSPVAPSVVATSSVSRPVLYAQPYQAGPDSVAAPTTMWGDEGTALADDFVVPEGECWRLTHAVFVGIEAAPPVEQLRVTLYRDDAGLPGAVVTSEVGSPLRSGASTAQRLELPLAPAIDLQANVYWVGAIVEATTEMTQWNWWSSATGVRGAPFAHAYRGFLLPTDTCGGPDEWVVGHECLMNLPPVDLAFTLYGESCGP